MSKDPAARPLYTWYGDDFTGSTDVLEALALHGVKAVLFTRTPDARALTAFSDCRAVGIAGESRSRSPHWMSRNLPAIFRTMRRLGAPVNHYKVCSTFDSSPRVGSIGRAMELGRAVFRSGTVPVVVGAPHLGRAMVFGNLFAEADGVWYRIDRHPTMRHHPVTPMNEADLRLHLARQTKLSMGLVDLTAFQSHTAQKQWQNEIDARAGAVVFDGFSDAMLKETARILWRCAAKRAVFAAGSSGLTHGLLHHWRSMGLIGAAQAPQPAPPIDRLLVLSGSCSPVTARQI
ncbi:MAG: four-carbon acid sugar kinase family protein, partial [Terracidiphilus sp.]|nr:four-carbon acid sugar kinase family protein [Terracidiphilus sp.]